jgi:DNA invertase Pin-like site-specific DNA recombinase
MKARYIRISSSIGQSTARQEYLAAPDEKLYIDICSGSVKFLEREKGKQLTKDIEAGLVTTVITSQLDRLGRSANDIQRTLEFFMEHNVEVIIENIGQSSKLPNGKINPIFKMITDILANLAEQQRESILENQKQGILAAKARGWVYRGRIKGTKESDEIVLEKYKVIVKELKMNPTLSLEKIARLCNDSLNNGEKKLSPNTVRKVKMILEKQANEKGND